jgi:23S rRNA (pseudouridine1915-N3)-methyltransferase
MKIKIFSFGKVKFPFIQDAIAEFESRISKLATLENVFLKEQPTDKKNIELSLKEEEKQILKIFKPSVTTYLLVENSHQYTSIDFAKRLENDMAKNGPEVHFFIGSPYGFSPNVKKVIANHLSLSMMTFTHDMARYLLLEQVYRSLTIHKNIPYHN